ncbi:unnamed protein product [Mytilus edulis]|uniref:Uncharacterized protein n=1 Tax=Mytilus edulis TaxID=6550 RepID=A0A8S3VMY1_MYTED|nr:unnamed protein product [Mytilus edulis]
MKGHVERKHPEKMKNERKEVDHKKKNPKSKIETPALQNFQFTPIASPTPIYLVVPDDLTLENAHQPNLFPEMPRQTGSPVSLLSLLNNYNNTTQLHVLVTTPASPEVERYDPEKPEMDRREAIKQVSTKCEIHGSCDRRDALSLEIKQTTMHDEKKNSVLPVIPDLQTHKHRRDVLLLFNDDVGAAIKQATKANNDDEAMILYKATQIVHFLKEELYMES